MSLDYVSHADLARFGDERVNLKRDDAVKLRSQANSLRDRLSAYLDEHPDFELKRLLLSGSLAKGTALKSTSDIDVACYVASDTAPQQIGQLIDWLATRLERAFPNFKPSQIERKTYSVAVHFVATGNEVDIVPILYAGDPAWRGDLISQNDGSRLMTSVPMHLEFVKRRKDAAPKHFAQVVRLAKYWAGLQKQVDSNFRFKSFMIELILAHLADKGMRLDNYIDALSSFFTFLAGNGLAEVIAFSDYYSPADCAATSDPVRIWDPVNCENNVAKLYSPDNRARIADSALDAGDAVDSALRAITKGETIRYWQKVFGPAFDT
jgi:tRNA nucleotidyltransferase (CCA-adding enzyme)